MANQIALRVWCNPGQTLLTEPYSHVVRNERRATALAAIVVQHAAGDRGHLTPESLTSALNERPPPRLIWLEDTHMLAGGTAMPAGWTATMGAICGKHGVGLHLDGSRLPNAAIARGESLATAAAGAVTVSISLNKALGAPLGAILSGPREVIDQAADWRDMLGGNWRPVGPLAAAARAALRGWEQRLRRDHALAADLAARLRAALGDIASTPDTNIILLRCRPGVAGGLVQAIGEAGVAVLALAPDTIRLVLHGGVSPSDIPLVAEAVIGAFDPARANAP